VIFNWYQSITLAFGLTTLGRYSLFGYIHLLHLLFVCAQLVFMASLDFSSIKSPPKFDGLNFPIWKVKMNLFLKSLGVRVAKSITKEFVKRHGDKDIWSEATAKDYKANTKAQYTLTQALNEDDLSHVINCKSAYEVCNDLIITH